MNEKTSDWTDLQLFLAVAREGGLSPAARATGRSAATLGRRMLALERAMGRDLFTRHDRGYTLTAQGQALLDELGTIETRLDRLTARPGTEARPLVKVSAGSWTTLALLEQLDALTGAPPDVRLRFVADEQLRDIGHREVVIGIRNTRPTETALAARRLARVEFAPYALPDAPRRWIKGIGNTPSARWLDRHAGADAICEVTSPRNSLDLALAGKGMALLPCFIGDTRLPRVGDPVAELAHDRWLVCHHEDRHLPQVRRVVERLAIVLGPKTMPA